MPADLVHYALIDWGDDGLFDGPYDDVTADVLAAPGISAEHGRDTARSLSPPMVTAAGYELTNVSQRYSAEFPGSPLYQQVTPGHGALLGVVHGRETGYDEAGLGYDDPRLWDGRQDVTLFDGLVDDLPQYPGHARRAVGVKLYGRELHLSRRRAYTALYEGYRVDQLMDAVCDAVGWPSDWRDFDVCSTTLAWWYADGEWAWDALVKLANAEHGTLYWDPSRRVLRMQARTYRQLNERATTSRVTIYDRAGQVVGYDDALDYDAREFYDAGQKIHHVGEPEYSPGFKDVVNVVRVATEAITKGLSTMVLWTSPAVPIVVAAGGSVEVEAELDSLVYDALCTNGLDVTASAGTVTSVSLTRASGRHLTVTIASTGGCTVDLVQIRAKPVNALDGGQVRNTVDTTASQAKYGESELTVDAPTGLSRNQGIDLANAIATSRRTPRPTVKVTLWNADDAHAYWMFNLAISDRITVVESQTGLAHDFWINRIAHQVDAAGKLHSMTLFAERTDDDAAAYTWDGATALWGAAVWAA